MVATVGGLLTDPRSLSYTISNINASSTNITEMTVDVGNLLIRLTRIGNLTADGVTIQCVYSRLKQIWLSDPKLTDLLFPMNPMTNEQFDMINGWNWDGNINATTTITVANCNVTAGFNTVSLTSGVLPDFYTSNVYIGANVAGTGIPSGTVVNTLNSNILPVSYTHLRAHET